MAYPDMLNDAENAAASAFWTKHSMCARRMKADRASATIDIVATGIGLHIDITCNVCGKSKDISDYDSW